MSNLSWKQYFNIRLWREIDVTNDSVCLVQLLVYYQWLSLQNKLLWPKDDSDDGLWLLLLIRNLSSTSPIIIFKYHNENWPVKLYIRLFLCPHVAGMRARDDSGMRQRDLDQGRALAKGKRKCSKCSKAGWLCKQKIAGDACMFICKTPLYLLPSGTDCKVCWHQLEINKVRNQWQDVNTQPCLLDMMFVYYYIT